MAEGGLSKGAKIVLWVLAGFSALVLIAVGAGFYWWKTRGSAWAGELRQAGQESMAEGKAAGANASKEDCIKLALARMQQGSGITAQVRVELFLESCLDASRGDLAFCNDAPPTDEIMATVSWRLKTSAALGLAQSENPIVKGIQKHCAGR